MNIGQRNKIEEILEMYNPKWESLQEFPIPETLQRDYWLAEALLALLARVEDLEDIIRSGEKKYPNP